MKIVYIRLGILVAIIVAALFLGLLAEPPHKETPLERQVRLLEERLAELPPGAPDEEEVRAELEETRAMAERTSPEAIRTRAEELRAELPNLEGAALEEAERDLRRLEAQIPAWYDRLPFRLGLDLRGGTEVRLRFLSDERQLNRMQEEYNALVEAGEDTTAEAQELSDRIRLEREELQRDIDAAVDVIRRRLNASGLEEIPVTRQGPGRLLVQLPGMDSAQAQRVIERIQALGQLEFRFAVTGEADDPGARNEVVQWIEEQGFTENTYNISYDKRRVVTPDEVGEDGFTVDGYPLYDYLRTPDRVNPDGTVTPGQFFVVEKAVQMDGRQIYTARPEPDEGLNWRITFILTERGKRLFGRVTSQNIGRRLGIVLDNQLVSAPRVQSAITGGRGEITGAFDTTTAKDLAIVLKSGSLRVQIEKEYESTVGPTLGEDSIRSGLQAMLAGVVCVVVFMIIYYLVAGALAVVALGVNVLLIAAAIVVFGATLTLPGIAGLILTIGMAVDANVLIFERIREERKKGNPLAKAIHVGFERAFVTILDANVTTFFTAVVLHSFGTEAVKGFAAILMIGILTSMFSALVITRWLLDALVQMKAIRELRMFLIFERPTINFLGIRRTAMAVSAVVILAGLALVVSRGERNFGHDFTGGTLAQIALTEPLTMEEARARAADLRAAGFDDVNITSFGLAEDGGFREFVIRTKKVNPEEGGTLEGRMGAVTPADTAGLAAAEEIAGTSGTDVQAGVAIRSAEEFKGAIAEAYPLQSDGLNVVRPLPERSTGEILFFEVRLALETPRSPAEIMDLLAENTLLRSPQAVRAGASLPPLPEASRAEAVVEVNRTAPSGQPLSTDAMYREALLRAAADMEQTLFDPEADLLVLGRLPGDPAKPDKVRLRIQLDLARAATAPEVYTALLSDASPLTGVRVELVDPSAVEPPSPEPVRELRVVAGVARADAAGVSLGETALAQSMQEQFQTLRRQGLLAFTDPFPRFTSVGPVVATDLLGKAVMAVLISLVVIFFYIWLRFQFRASFGLGAVVALLHDVLFTVGVLALVDQLGLFNAQIDLTIIAALLTIVGYSLNDTIVVFDRIRENLHGHQRSVQEVINGSVNQTLSRTIITSLTTLLVVLVLLVWGGDVIRGFAFSLFVGVMVGTYSSIFIASPILVEFAHLKQAREKKKLDARFQSQAGAGGGQ